MGENCIKKEPKHLPITVRDTVSRGVQAAATARDYDCDVSEWTADRVHADSLLPLSLEGSGSVADAGVAIPR